jgi:hypothetical protein
VTDDPKSWPSIEDAVFVPWLPVEPVRMGFGGLVYWRSRDHINGRYRWEVSPSAMPAKEPTK